MNKGLETLFLENAAADLISAAIILAGLLALVLLVKWVAINRLLALAQRTSTSMDDAAVAALRRTRLWLIAFPAVYVAAGSLELADRVRDVLGTLATVAFLAQAGFWAMAFFNSWIERSEVRARESDIATATGIAVMRFGAKVMVWALVLLMVLDNLGVDVTALIAGLGIGGVAVALAVQSTLGDVFASLSIVVDKPFAVGDFIVVDDFMGTVENVGIKTTRVRSLAGEQIVFPNNSLLQTRVRNYKRMRDRRILFTFGILYQTPLEKLEQVPHMVREIIEKVDKTRFDRAHFKAFGDSSYDFEVVYWVLDPDYNRYMDIQQTINLGVVRAFAENRIEFAYPTRTLFVEPTEALLRAREAGQPGRVDQARH